MPTVRYTTVNGEVIAEKRNGIRSLYVPDALGATVALLDNTQTKTDTFEYWPYGEVRTRTGTTPTPLQFVGTAGYYKDSATRTYVRSRTVDLVLGQWITEDPTPLTSGHMFDSAVSTYAYCDNQPASMIDPAGERPEKPPRIVIGAQPFDPFWWNQGNRRGSQNCYSYACNQPFPHSIGNPFPQPGGGVKDPCSCKSVEEAVAKGGWLKPRRGKHCPAGTYTVILFVGSPLIQNCQPICDYHFMRLDANGLWSDKRGGLPVGDPALGSGLIDYPPVQFTDPYHQARKLGYETVCQHYCAPGLAHPL